MTEHQFKILIIGDVKVGKSSFVHRYVNGQFNRNYKTTMGAEFTLKLLLWTDTKKVRLQLWDIAGQERFISMNRIYYKGASGCVVMFDVSNSASFQSCRHWKQDLDNKSLLSNGQPLPCILLANKCDLTERVVSVESIQRFSQDCGFTCWMETSVKDNRNVNEAMRCLVEEMLSIVSPVPPSDIDTMGFHLDSVELNAGPVLDTGCCSG